MDKPIIKVLVGQRRVGKSYVLMQLKDRIQKEHPLSNSIYINKEDFAFDHIQNAHDLVKYVDEQTIKDQKNYLFIDEIQEITHFEKGLRHFLLKENFDIYCTGSNANLLSGELSTYLGGRYIEIKIYTLSFIEFLDFHQMENNKESLKKYLLWGGLPFLKNIEPKDEVVAEYLENIANAIVYKDVVTRFQLRNSHFLNSLIFYLSQHLGSLISAKKISDYLKNKKSSVSVQVVINYLNYLQHAFLIHKVARYDIQGKKVFELNDKFYFEDWGLAHAMIGFSRFDISKTIENVVFINLRINGYKVFVGKHKQEEIDFVAEKEGRKVYFQITYLLTDDKVKEREFGNLTKIKDSYPKYVISLDEYAPEQIDGVNHLHLWNFLNQEEF